LQRGPLLLLLLQLLLPNGQFSLFTTLHGALDVPHMTGMSAAFVEYLRREFAKPRHG